MTLRNSVPRVRAYHVSPFDRCDSMIAGSMPSTQSVIGRSINARYWNCRRTTGRESARQATMMPS